MSNDLQMTVGNRWPTFTGQLNAADGTGVPLVGYDAFLVVTAVDGGTVFGVPSPLVQACSISDAADGGVLYDWTQPQVDAARAGVYDVAVRAVKIADPTDTFEMSPQRGARIIIRSGPAGHGYVLAENGALVLVESGVPIDQE